MNKCKIKNKRKPGLIVSRSAFWLHDENVFIKIQCEHHHHRSIDQYSIVDYSLNPHVIVYHSLSSTSHLDFDKVSLWPSD